MGTIELCVIYLLLNMFLIYKKLKFLEKQNNKLKLQNLELENKINCIEYNTRTNVTNCDNLYVTFQRAQRGDYE